MQNKFDGYTQQELIEILCEQDLTQNDLKQVFAAFYNTYCKTKNQTPAQLSFSNLRKKNDNEEIEGRYLNGKIQINTSNFDNMFSKDKSIDRLKVISTLIHENRHFVQDKLSPCSTAQKFASLSQKTFNVFSLANWLIFEQYQDKIKNGTPLEKSINTALAQEHISEFIDYKSIVYGMLPHEIDARNHTQEELYLLKKISPEFGKIIDQNAKESKIFQEFCCFSMFEHFDYAHKFFDCYKNELDPQMQEQHADYKSQVLSLYKKFSVTTLQEEKAFIKNLFPIEFGTSKNYFK